MMTLLQSKYFGLLLCVQSWPACGQEASPLTSKVTGAEPQSGQAPSRTLKPASAPPVAVQPSAQAETNTNDIIVSGKRTRPTTAIDRKSYALGDKLEASSGSVADVLRNLPSVTLDVDGNPSLRGDANVQILIDGRPAPQFNNANRGVALQQLGADGIERVEVLTNPPANFKPDGSAGIINIITKKRLGSRAASATSSLGSGGRFNLGTTASTQVGHLAVHAALTLRHDLRTRLSSDDRTQSDPATADFVAASQQHVLALNNRLSKIATLGVDYDLSKVDRLSLEGTYNDRTEATAFEEQNAARDASGVRVGTADRSQRGHARETNTSAVVSYHRTIGKDSDGLTIQAQQSETSETEYFHYNDRYSGISVGPVSEDQKVYGDQVTREFSVELVSALPAKAKLTTGYNLERNDNTFDNVASTQLTDVSPKIPDPNFSNRFLYGQTIHALYASYERPFGRWTVLPGLRLEQVYIETNQVTADVRGRSKYFRFYPNLHISDALTDHQSLTLSIGRRVIRPDPEDLNPYPVQQDAFTRRQGNPALLPEEIQSFEAGWSFERGSTSRSATLYLRQSRNRVTNVAVAISPSVIAITKQNLGSSTSGGVELAVAGKAIKNISYNLSGNAFYNVIDASNLGFSRSRSTFSYELKLALNWRATLKDTIQLNVGSIGQRLVPQGYRPASLGVDLGGRHQLQKNLSVTATLSDVFATRHDGMVTSTPGLTDISRRHQSGQIFFIGLSWSLPGAKTKSNEKFEYDKATG